MVIVIVLIQFGNNFVEWGTDALFTRRKIDKVRAAYEPMVNAIDDKDLLGKADMELAQFCEEQMVMKSEKGD